MFLDSARCSNGLGRFSFVTADPFDVISCGMGSPPLQQLNQCLGLFRIPKLDGALPPFRGGAVGFCSYDLNRSLERIPPSQFNEFQLPLMHFGLYDVVVAFDHQLDKAWLISLGLPELQSAQRARRAEARATQFLHWLRNDESPRDSKPARPELSPSELSPSFPTQHAELLSNFEEARYIETVGRVIDYIHAGDVFQVNLAQRLLHRSSCDSVSLYLKLRDCNPAPFAAYYDLGDHQILSTSPERFLMVQNRSVEARPIKGTRQRTPAPEADLFSAEELRASSKDLAENVMIVDLMRNDLSRVCEDESVEVSDLCRLESYEFVKHLVSVVRGELRTNVSPAELIAATFPGGSITGAPKVRAMQIIAELEPTARGAYCGSLGYIGFDGEMDLNILIRTITASRGWWQLPVGGGIVAQSDPEAEYLETWHKAKGMLRAIL